jgi:hypothetical protein
MSNSSEMTTTQQNKVNMAPTGHFIEPQKLNNGSSLFHDKETVDFNIFERRQQIMDHAQSKDETTRAQLKRIKNKEEAFEGLFVKPKHIKQKTFKEIEVEKQAFGEFKNFYTETEDAKLDIYKEREARMREEYYNRVMTRQALIQDLDSMFSITAKQIMNGKEQYDGQYTEISYYQAFQN